MQLQTVMRTLIFSMSALAACAAPVQELRPTDASTYSRGGEPAAVYEVRDDSQRLAEVVLSSQGAYASESQGTVVHVVAEVRNVGVAPISVDVSALELQLFDESGAELARPRLLAIAPAGGEIEPVAPTTARELDIYFAVPAPILPEQIGSLRMRWALKQPDGRAYTQFTDFIQDAPRATVHARAYVPIYGFYDPFFWGPRMIRIHHVPVRRVVVPHHPRHFR